MSVKNNIADFLTNVEKTKIKELFELARRAGLHVEEAMADILGELKH